MARTRMVSLDSITVDHSVNQREEGLDSHTVKQYVEDIENGAEFPPVVIYEQCGDLWLSEGFHRVAAFDQLEHQKIRAEVRPGGRIEAVVNACGSNAEHGARRTNADKRRAVKTMQALYPKRSARWIAEKAKVNPSTVDKCRQELPETGSSQTGGNGCRADFDIPEVPVEAYLDYEPMSDAAPAPDYEKLHGVPMLRDIERYLLDNREDIDETPATVAAYLSDEWGKICPEGAVQFIQEQLKEGCRVASNGRKFYERTYTCKPKPTPKVWTATDAVDDICLTVSRLHDELAQQYGYKYSAIFESEDWNDLQTAVSLNSLNESIKLLQQFKKELTKHVKEVKAAASA